MKKHIELIFIYLLALAVFLGCQKDTDPDETAEPTAPATTGDEEEAPAAAYDSYVISEMQTIDTEGTEDYVHEGVIPCKLLNVIMDGNAVSALEIRFEDNTREIFNLEDIEGRVISYQDRDDSTAVEIEFYSGGKARYIKGEDMHIFVDSEGYYTFDSSKSISADIRTYKGEVTGFDFLPLSEEKKALVLEHIVVTLDNGNEINVPISGSRVQSINSKGDIHVDYEGSINNKHIFSISVDEDFGMIVNYKNNDVEVFSIGKTIELEKIDSSTYKLADNYDNTMYTATVEEFVLLHEDGKVTGLDKMIFSIEDMDDISMTMMDTNCDYGVPFGNILREYDSIEGSEDMLTAIMPAKDFGIELYYGEKVNVKLISGESVDIFRDFNGKWHIDAY